MLLNLMILNGCMSLEYDELVTTYTVNIDSDITSLVIDYEIGDGVNIEILNNDDLKEGVNYVYIVVSDDTNRETYTLEVYKEYIEEVIAVDEEAVELEVSEYASGENGALIGVSCILCILILFLVLFHPFKSC